MLTAESVRSDQQKQRQFSLTNDADLSAFFSATLDHSEYDTVNIENGEMIWRHTRLLNKAHGDWWEICRHKAQCGAAREFLIL